MKKHNSLSLAAIMFVVTALGFAPNAIFASVYVLNEMVTKNSNSCERLPHSVWEFKNTTSLFSSGTHVYDPRFLPNEAKVLNWTYEVYLREGTVSAQYMDLVKEADRKQPDGSHIWTVKYNKENQQLEGAIRAVRSESGILNTLFGKQKLEPLGDHVPVVADFGKYPEVMEKLKELGPFVEFGRLATSQENRTSNMFSLLEALISTLQFHNLFNTGSDQAPKDLTIVGHAKDDAHRSVYEFLGMKVLVDVHQVIGAESSKTNRDLIMSAKLSDMAYHFNMLYQYKDLLARTVDEALDFAKLQSKQFAGIFRNKNRSYLMTRVRILLEFKAFDRALAELRDMAEKTGDSPDIRKWFLDIDRVRRAKIGEDQPATSSELDQLEKQSGNGDVYRDSYLASVLETGDAQICRQRRIFERYKLIVNSTAAEYKNFFELSGNAEGVLRLINHDLAVGEVSPFSELYEFRAFLAEKLNLKQQAKRYRNTAAILRANGWR